MVSLIHWEGKNSISEATGMFNEPLQSSPPPPQSSLTEILKPIKEGNNLIELYQARQNLSDPLPASEKAENSM